MSRIRLPEWLRNEIKKIVRESMDEWTSDCQYLTQDKGDGAYSVSYTHLTLPTNREV